MACHLKILYKCIHAHLHAAMHKYIYIHIRTYTHIYIYIYVYIYVYIHICICTHTCIRIRSRFGSSSYMFNYVLHIYICVWMYICFFSYCYGGDSSAQGPPIIYWQSIAAKCFLHCLKQSSFGASLLLLQCHLHCIKTWPSHPAQTVRLARRVAGC